MSKTKITQKKGLIGATITQKATVKTLGLKRIGHSVVWSNGQVLDGMLKKVSHLVKTEQQDK